MSTKVKEITYYKKVNPYNDWPLNFNFFTEKKFIFSEMDSIFYSNDDKIKKIIANESGDPILHLLIDKNQDIIACSSDKTIKKFKIEENQEILIFKSDIIFKKIILLKNSKYGLFDKNNNFYIFNLKTQQIETKINLKIFEDIDLAISLISFYFQYKNEFIFIDKNTFIEKYSLIKKYMKNLGVNINSEKKNIFLINPKEIEVENKDKLENLEYFEFIKINKDKDEEKSINIKVKIGKIYEPFRCDSYYYDEDENIIYFTFVLWPDSYGWLSSEDNKDPFLYIGKVLLSENAELYAKEIGTEESHYVYQIFKIGKKLIIVKCNSYFFWKCQIIDCDSGYERLKEFKVIPQ